MESDLKKHFNVIYTEAVQMAKKDLEKIIEQSKNYENYEKLKLLDEEKSKLEKLIEEDSHPYYVTNHKAQDWLFSQFYKRAILLYIDESDEFKQSVYLGVMSSKLSLNIAKCLKQIPKYSYQQFLNGEECKYFSTFKEYYNISKEDYYKIIDYRINNLINISCNIANFWLTKITIYAKQLEEPNLFYENEYALINNFLKNKKQSSNSIKQSLSKLLIFKNTNLNYLNDDLLLLNYSVYNRAYYKYDLITPITIKSPLESIKSKQYIDNEYTIFYTLEQLKNQLNLILNKKPVQNLAQINLTEIVKNTIERAENESVNLNNSIVNYLNNSDESDDVIKQYLSKELDVYREKFNNFKDKELFQIYSDDNSELINTIFKMYVFNSGFIDDHIKNIDDVVAIYMASWDILSLHFDYFENRDIYNNPKDSDLAKVDVYSLQDKFIQTKKNYTLFETFKVNFFNSLQKYSLPPQIHIKNHVDELKKIFEFSLRTLENAIENAEPNAKLFYLKNSIKDLKIKELKLRTIDSREYNKNDYTYSEYLLNYFKLEEEYLNNPTPAISLPFLTNKPKPKKNSNIQQSFKYLSFDTNPDAITNLRDSLIKNNFIDENTKLTDFKKVFSGGEINSKIIWKGNISELSFFIKNLIMDKNSIQDLKLKHWKVTINCFVMDDESEITTANLRGAKLPARLNLIENALKNL